MLTYRPLSLIEIRTRLAQCLTGAIGQYNNGELAIWVLDRPVPDDLKVLTSESPESYIPALEVVINPFCSMEDQQANYNQALVSEITKVYLIWHDQRQPTRLPALALMAAFKGYLPSLAYLDESELHKRQHVLTITNKIMVGDYA